MPRASAARRASPRSSSSTAPASTATPARPAVGRQLHRARADRRHVDAQLLPGLGTLGQHPAARAVAAGALALGLGNAPQHRIGAFRALDRQHLAVGHHDRLAGVERPEHGPHRKPQLRVAAALAVERHGAEPAAPGQQVGRHLVRAQHREPLGLEEAHHAREHRIVAPLHHAENLRQAEEEAQIHAQLPKVGPAHAAGDHHGVALGAQRRHHAADLAPVHPGMRKAGDGRIGLALDADDVHGAATRDHALGNHQG